jgi:tetratricopeptide (TPR) repeat protein
METNSQLAFIEMHLGNYDESQKRLDTLQIAQQVGGSLTRDSDMMHILIRNESELLLLQGRYSDSQTGLDDLRKRGKKDATCLRLLALTSAHLGQLEAAENYINDAFTLLESGGKFPPRSHEPAAPAFETSGSSRRCQTYLKDKTESSRPWELQKYMLLHAKAVTYRVSGNYSGFLREAQSSLRGLRDSLPATHFRILEATTLEAEALAHMSDLKGAEASCLRALSLIKDNLGVKHPQHLHAMSVLVLVFRLQSRLQESVATGRSLVAVMGDILGAYHPVTLDCREELSIAYSLSGMYLSAAEEIDKVVSISQSQGDERPDIGRYLCTQASIYLAAGRTDDARQKAMDALKHQLNSWHYLASRCNHYPDWHENEDTVLKRIFLYLEKDIRAGLNAPPEDLPVTSTTVVHLLDTTEVLARVQLRRLKENHGSVTLFPVQNFLRSAFTLRAKLLGEDHHLTLQAQFWLAQSLSEDPSESLRLLRHVYIRRKEVLGDFHLDTLTTKMDYIKTSCVVNQWESPNIEKNPGHEPLPGIVSPGPGISPDGWKKKNPSHEPLPDIVSPGPGISPDGWKKLVGCSQEVAAQQDAALGEDHPETINSLIWVMTLWLTHDSPCVDIWNTIHERLGRPHVRRERLIEVSSTKDWLKSIRLGLGQGSLPEPPEIHWNDRPATPNQEREGKAEQMTLMRTNLEQAGESRQEQQPIAQESVSPSRGIQTAESEREMPARRHWKFFRPRGSRFPRKRDHYQHSRFSWPW